MVDGRGDLGEVSELDRRPLAEDVGRGPEFFGDVRRDGSDEEGLDADEEEDEVGVHTAFLSGRISVRVASGEGRVEAMLERLLVESPAER